VNLDNIYIICKKWLISNKCHQTIIPLFREFYDNES